MEGGKSTLLRELLGLDTSTVEVGEAIWDQQMPGV